MHNNLHYCIKEYSRLLFGDGESLCAMRYLKDTRKVKESTLKEFNIGYCHKDSDISLFCGENKEEQEFHKKNLSGKIIVPIQSEFDDFLAVACRSPNPDGKWWNTVFEKNNNLFIINKSKEHMLETKKAYIVEGYFDAIILFQEGITNVCALMGTSLGHRRMGLMARYCDEICMCLDADLKNKAGQLAMAKSIHEMYQYGWNKISVIQLPLGQDPDEYVIENGKDKFFSLERKLTHKDIVRISKKYQDFVKK